MKHRLMILVSSVSLLAFAGCASAHGPGYGHPYDDHVSGSVTIWSGSPWGGGYAGTISYRAPHYAPPRPYAEALWYSGCGHWHAPGYRHATKHAYRDGYAHGYSKGPRHGRHGRRGDHHRHHH